MNKVGEVAHPNQTALVIVELTKPHENARFHEESILFAAPDAWLRVLP